MSRPSKPSTAYIDSVGQDIAAKVAMAKPPAPFHETYENQTRYWQQCAEIADSSREQLAHIVHDLHAHPETAFAEHRSMAMLAELVENQGHETVRGAFGVETAFTAQACSKNFDPQVHPTVAIMAEYDALPGIGHACGHNVIAAAGVGAFLIAAKVLAQSGVEGRIVLQGTPAEEGHTGKEYMIRGGSLNGVDAAIMVHGFGYDIASHAWVGRRSATIEFHGVAAHASSQPFMGRNALDAANLAYQGMGLLRQQMPPSDRLHAIISAGGKRPSIIPEHAAIEVYVRSLGTQTLLDLSERVEEIAHGAALMAACGVEIHWDPHPMSLPVRNNETLAERWARTQAQRGRTALPAGTVPDTFAASTDFGNVSHLVPGIHPMVKVSPEEVALHTEDFARWANTESAVDAAVDSAAGLAQVAMDFLGDAELREDATTEFARAGGAVSVEQLLSGQPEGKAED